jgi:hypothetical protein
MSDPPFQTLGRPGLGHPCDATEEPYGPFDIEAAVDWWTKKVVPEFRRRWPDRCSPLLVEVEFVPSDWPYLTHACLQISKWEDFPERTAAVVLALYHAPWGRPIHYTVAVVVLFEALERHQRFDTSGRLNLGVPSVPPETFFDRLATPEQLGDWIRTYCASSAQYVEWQELYRRHIGPAMQYVELLTSRDVAAPDLALDAFTRTWSAARPRHRPLDPSPSEAHSANFVIGFYSSCRQGALARRSDRGRPGLLREEVLLLSRVAGLSRREIAEILHLPDSQYAALAPDGEETPG